MVLESAKREMKREKRKAALAELGRRRAARHKDIVPSPEDRRDSKSPITEQHNARGHQDSSSSADNTDLSIDTIATSITDINDQTQLDTDMQDINNTATPLKEQDKHAPLKRKHEDDDDGKTSANIEQPQKRRRTPEHKIGVARKVVKPKDKDAIQRRRQRSSTDDFIVPDEYERAPKKPKKPTKKVTEPPVAPAKKAQTPSEARKPYNSAYQGTAFQASTSSEAIATVAAVDTKSPSSTDGLGLDNTDSVNEGSASSDTYALNAQINTDAPTPDIEVRKGIRRNKRVVRDSETPDAESEEGVSVLDDEKKEKSVIQKMREERQREAGKMASLGKIAKREDGEVDEKAKIRRPPGVPKGLGITRQPLNSKNAHSDGTSKSSKNECSPKRKRAVDEQSEKAAKKPKAADASTVASPKRKRADDDQPEQAVKKPKAADAPTVAQGNKKQTATAVKKKKATSKRRATDGLASGTFSNSTTRSEIVDEGSAKPIKKPETVDEATSKPVEKPDVVDQEINKPIANPKTVDEAHQKPVRKPKTVNEVSNKPVMKSKVVDPLAPKPDLSNPGLQKHMNVFNPAAAPPASKATTTKPPPPEAPISNVPTSETLNLKATTFEATTSTALASKAMTSSRNQPVKANDDKAQAGIRKNTTSKPKGRKLNVKPVSFASLAPEYARGTAKSAAK